MAVEALNRPLIKSYEVNADSRYPNYRVSNDKIPPDEAVQEFIFYRKVEGKWVYATSHVKHPGKSFHIGVLGENNIVRSAGVPLKEVPFWRYLEIINFVIVTHALPFPDYEKDRKYPVCITEGAKDALTLLRVGFQATCSCSSAGLREEDAQYLGRRVVLFGDNDDAGRRRIDKDVRLLNGKVCYLKVVFAPEGYKDITEYVEGGGFKDDEEKRMAVFELIEKADCIREDVVLDGEESQTNQVFEEKEMRSYPIDSYPPLLRKGIFAFSAITQFPLEACAAMVCSVGSFVMGHKNYIWLNQWTKTACHCFFLILGESGEYKSSTFGKILRPIIEVEEEEEEEYADEMDKFERELEDLEEDKKEIRKTKCPTERECFKKEFLTKKKLLRNKKPIPNERTSNGATGAALHKLISDCKGWFYYYSGDGGKVLDNILGKGDGTDGSLNDSYLLSYTSGESVSIHRRGKGKSCDREKVKDPALSLCICVQPERAEEFLNHSIMRSGGMINRMVIVQGKSLMGTRVRRPQVKNEKDFEAMLEAFKEEYKKNRKSDESRDFDFDQEGHELMDEYYDKTEKMLPDGAKGEDIRGILSRGTCRVAQRALFFERFSGGKDVTHVSGEIVKNAIEVVDWEIDETARHLRKGNEDPVIALAKKCSERLSKQKLLEKSTFTRQDFSEAFSYGFTKHKRKYKNLKIVDEVLDLLVEWERIEAVPGKKNTYRPKGRG